MQLLKVSKPLKRPIGELQNNYVNVEDFVEGDAQLQPTPVRLSEWVLFFCASIIIIKNYPL